jgi:hypothetical protein
MYRHAPMLAISGLFATGATAAQANIAISSGATQNMSCTNGVCAPTAKDAVLNVTDLENLLASGNVTIMTTGSGVQARDIHVSARLSWTNLNTLALDAFRSIAINAAVLVSGQGGLSLVNNDGGNGMLSFGAKGSVGFQNLSSSLTINGVAYALVDTVKSLAKAIKANPAGDYALARNYNATGDGTYASSPVQVKLSGVFEGLGNKIKNLSIDDEVDGDKIGLFSSIGRNGAVRDIGLTNVNVAGGFATIVGSLAGLNQGTITGSYATGALGTWRAGEMGGLVGENAGLIRDSHASAEEGDGDYVGGLVGDNAGTISQSYSDGAMVASIAVGGLVAYNFGNGKIIGSFATGAVELGTDAGGLVGYNAASIQNSYATGAVSVGVGASAGGLVGFGAGSPVSTSYSTGAISGPGDYVGGLVGYDSGTDDFQPCYWDTDTSGIANLSQGAGNIPNDPGITGLTTAQLQSGLPQGFDPKIWAEKSTINGGLPYLKANLPRK